MEATATKHEQEEQAKFTFIVDDREFSTQKPTVTGGEIMDMAGIPHSQGLMVIKEDGTQDKVEVGTVVDLKQELRFKKKPRFKRGYHE